MEIGFTGRSPNYIAVVKIRINLGIVEHTWRRSKKKGAASRYYTD